jgi:hypothetical protein
MLISRPPHPRLRPFVKMLWVSAPSDGQHAVPGAREHVLPTGDMHLVFRLSDTPLRLFHDEYDADGETASHAGVGGARSAFYARFREFSGVTLETYRKAAPPNSHHVLLAR